MCANTVQCVVSCLPCKDVLLAPFSLCPPGPLCFFFFSCRALVFSLCYSMGFLCPRLGTCLSIDLVKFLLSKSFNLLNSPLKAALPRSISAPPPVCCPVQTRWVFSIPSPKSLIKPVRGFGASIKSWRLPAVAVRLTMVHSSQQVQNNASLVPSSPRLRCHWKFCAVHHVCNQYFSWTAVQMVLHECCVPDGLLQKLFDTHKQFQTCLKLSRARGGFLGLLRLSRGCQELADP